MNLEIDDYELQQEPLIAKRIYIKLVELRFNESAKFEVYFYKAIEEYDMRLVKTEIIEIKDDEYKEWKNDDNYIIDLIFRKLGIQKKNTISNDDLGVYEQ